MKKEIPAVPGDGAEFKLTLNSTVDPLEMVKGDDYNPQRWKFMGSAVVPGTRKFKLVRVGYCANLNKVRAKLVKHGSIPEGLWREAFKKAFPRNDGQGSIGFADPSWVDPFGYANFPVLDHGEDWRSHFYWAGNARDERWRWLVEVKEA